MQKFKARAIFTNDAECDDMNSFLHLLLYANDVDIEGLVLSSSCFHFEGDPAAGIEPKRWAGGQWMWDYLDAYEKAYPNLAVHDSAYPTPDYLRSVTCIGNVKTVGCMDEDTPGSELIRQRGFFYFLYHFAFSDYEALPVAAADAEVSFSCFARSVHHAAHDRDFKTCRDVDVLLGFEIIQPLFHIVYERLKVYLRPAACRA